MRECDAVFEGGGIKGIGLVGAAKAFENKGYVFKNLAGSSAGAVVACLFAAGYNCRELEKILNEIDWKKFKQMDLWDYFGLPGKLFSLNRSYGIYETDYIYNWLKNLLNRKGISRFSDLKSQEKYVYGKNHCRLQVTAADITDKNLLVLPDDFVKFGIKPEDADVALAIRMSLSIPFFYVPCEVKDKVKKRHYIVDGGLMSNYPIWILDNGTKNLERPVFGFRFIDDYDKICKESKDKIQSKDNFFEYIKDVISTALDAADTQTISNMKGDEKRTIFISTTISCTGSKQKISTTDFDLTKQQSDALFKNGIVAGEKFIKSWSFDGWKQKYRANL